jgi:hypothetical protein
MTEMTKLGERPDGTTTFNLCKWVRICALLSYSPNFLVGKVIQYLHHSTKAIEIRSACLSPFLSLESVLSPLGLLSMTLFPEQLVLKISVFKFAFVFKSEYLRSLEPKDWRSICQESE